MRLLRLLFVLLAASVCCSANAQTPRAGSEGIVEVQETLNRFIHAFCNLDWEAFRQFFADDATVFYPRQFPTRANGRTEYEETFRRVFEEIRGTKQAPPYMRIEPRNLRIQMEGEIAIVTFHLDDRPGMLNRRTIILKKKESGWKVIHLHASEVAIGSAPRPAEGKQ